MNERNETEVRDAVRQHYGKVAKQGASAGCAPGCCGAPQNDASLKLGYEAGDLASVPEGADMGLGCGNPQVIAALKAGGTAAVFREAFRVLKPGGRLAISDVVAVREPPAELKGQLAALAGCIAGAASLDAIRASLAEAGFAEPVIDIKEESRNFIRDWMPGSHAEDYVASATIQATKPKVAAACCGPSCCEGKN
jgi:hypothetical protein